MIQIEINGHEIGFCNISKHGAPSKLVLAAGAMFRGNLVCRFRLSVGGPVPLDSGHAYHGNGNKDFTKVNVLWLITMHCSTFLGDK